MCMLEVHGPFNIESFLSSGGGPSGIITFSIFGGAGGGVWAGGGCVWAAGGWVCAGGGCVCAAGESPPIASAGSAKRSAAARTILICFIICYLRFKCERWIESNPSSYPQGP